MKAEDDNNKIKAPQLTIDASGANVEPPETDKADASKQQPATEEAPPAEKTDIKGNKAAKKSDEPKPEETPAEEAPTEEPTSLREAIKEQATEDEAPQSKNFTLRKILGGDILSTQTIRSQIGVILLITVFLIIYISNRYSCQQNLIQIDKLQKELQDAKYKALASSSQLTEKCRESHVLDMLKANRDSLLKIANQPPYIIQVEE